MQTVASIDSDGQPEGFAVIPIWFLRSQDFSHHAKTVFLHLSSRVNQHGAAWPSQDTLASDTGLGRATIQRALRDLREGGLISVSVERTATGRRNIYSLSVDRFGRGDRITLMPPIASV